ncbi:MAG TPA: sulfur carrier protein ThiS [Thermoanaerobaculia bacterium]|nr:sulfur carrier protein ThiS [Thermoanaerobaculia bacterium]
MSEPTDDQATVAVTLNGEARGVQAGWSVLDLVLSLGRDPRTVAVERNGDLVSRADFAAATLRAGDRLEVVHFVQGG